MKSKIRKNFSNSSQWSLKAPQHKIQSSFATYEFMMKELPIIQNKFDWRELVDLPNSTVRSKDEYDQHFITLGLASLGQHVEICKQSLYEYRERRKDLSQNHREHLEMIVDFLSLLRNSLLHTKGKLIPVWKNEDKNRLIRIKKSLFPKGFLLNIPGKNLSHGILFKEDGQDFYKLHIEVKLKKIITIDEDFLNKIRLVSWHILTITKKRKLSTLTKYLDHILKKRDY